MSVVVYIFLILLAAMALIPVCAECMRAIGHLEQNYKGKNIPQSMGVALPLVFVMAAAWAYFAQLLPVTLLNRAFVVAAGLGFLGLLDDIWGDHKVKGISGHFRRLFVHGDITTGLVKALLGFVICITAVYGLPGFFPLIIGRAAIVALSANLLNLLDLRPGRSIKGFFLLALFFILLVPQKEGILLLFPFLLTAFVLFSWDLAGLAMLGDTGSNVLGGVLGLAVVLYAPTFWQFLYFIFLVGIHLLTEKVSLSQVIAHNYFLRFLDNLGRPGWEK